MQLAQRTAIEPHRSIVVDDVVVSFTIPGPISDPCWNAFIDTIQTRRPAHCMLLCAGVANVDAAQRRRFTQTVMRTNSTVLVLTDNRLTRGLAMAVAWFGAKLDAYSWSQLPEVLQHMWIADDTRQRLADIALEFHGNFGHYDR